VQEEEALIREESHIEGQNPDWMSVSLETASILLNQMQLSRNMFYLERPVLGVCIYVFCVE